MTVISEIIFIAWFGGMSFGILIAIFIDYLISSIEKKKRKIKKELCSKCYNIVTRSSHEAMI